MPARNAPPRVRRLRRYRAIGGEISHRSTFADPHTAIEAAGWLLGREIRRLEMTTKGRDGRLTAEERTWLVDALRGLAEVMPQLVEAVSVVEPKPTIAEIHDDLLDQLAKARAALGFPAHGLTTARVPQNGRRTDLEPRDEDQ